jgi:hypothetical protein
LDLFENGFFLDILCFKILKGTLKDPEFYLECFSIVEILTELFFRKSHSFSHFLNVHKDMIA